MKVQAAIDSIWECKQQGIYYPSEWRGRLEVDEGYQVQLGILAKQTKAGERHVGWKVGLTAKAIQDQVNFHERVFGYLLASGELPSGATVPYDDMVAPSFETELVVILGEALKGPDITPERARAAIEAVAPSFELVEKRGDFAGEPALSMADNVQQRYYVLGDETEVAPGADLSATTVEVYINGEQVDRAAGSELRGGPEASVAWLANKLAGYGRPLERGAKILTGSFTRQYPIAQGDLIEARFTPFGTVIAEFA